MQSLCIRLKMSEYEAVHLPEATMFRVLTSTKDGEYVEFVYWLDSYLHSPKQIEWMGNIKSRIKQYLPEVEFIKFNKNFNYQSLSGENFSLNQLSELWCIATKDRPDIVIPNVKLPPLPSVDEDYVGDKEKLVSRELYRPMLIHCKNLYFYHCFNYETLMAGINAALRILKVKLSLKLKNKLCENVFNNFSKELLSNPHKYKQKLLGQKKEEEKKLRTDRLNQARKQKAEQSINDTKAIIAEAVTANPWVVKSNGKYNVSALAKLTGINRVTITKYLK